MCNFTPHMLNKIQQIELTPAFHKVQAGEDKLVVLYTTYRNLLKLHESYLKLLTTLSKPPIAPYWGQSEEEADAHEIHLTRSDQGSVRNLRHNPSPSGGDSRYSESKPILVRLGHQVANTLDVRDYLIQLRYVCRCVSAVPENEGIIVFCKFCHRIIEE